MQISIIAAIGKNRELGKDNKLLWHIPLDLKRFKNLTSGHAAIMGRKTFNSIGKALPNRINIVITKNKDFKAEGCLKADSLETAIEIAKEKEKAEIFIIGGASVYRQAIKLADKLYLTVIEAEFPQADVFFPDYSDFKKIIFSQRHKTQGYTFTFFELLK